MHLFCGFFFTISYTVQDCTIPAQTGCSYRSKVIKRHGLGGHSMEIEEQDTACVCMQGT